MATSITTQDAHTGEDLTITYDKETDTYNVNGTDCKRNEALEDEAGVVMLQGEGRVNHIRADDLAPLHQ